MMLDGTTTMSDLYAAIDRAHKSDSYTVRDNLCWVTRELRTEHNSLLCFGVASELNLSCANNCPYYADCGEFAPFHRFPKEFASAVVVLEEGES